MLMLAMRTLRYAPGFPETAVEAIEKIPLDEAHTLFWLIETLFLSMVTNVRAAARAN